VDDAAAADGHDHGHLTDLLGRHSRQILAEDDEVGELAGLEG